MTDGKVVIGKKKEIDLPNTLLSRVHLEVTPTTIKDMSTYGTMMYMRTQEENEKGI